MLDEQPLVSVVIPSYNSGKTIGICLKSISEQTYSNIEIIIVDKGSKDETAELARQFSAILINKDCERAEAKNYGISIAKGKYIMFVDSDMELTPRVVGDCVDALRREQGIGGIIIPERSVGEGFWVKVRDHERPYYGSTEIESARFFLREDVQNTTGFETDIVFFEESTLPQKIKAKGLSVDKRVSAEILHHEDNFSLGKWLRKKYYYGKTAKEYRNKYKEQGAAQMSLVYRYSMFLSHRSFYTRPFLALGVILLKSLEFGSAGLGYMSR